MGWIDGPDREGERERERGPFKNTKVDHSATLLESIRGGEDTPLLPTRMEISFFFSFVIEDRASYDRSFFLKFFLFASGLWQCLIDNW